MKRKKLFVASITICLLVGRITSLQAQYSVKDSTHHSALLQSQCHSGGAHDFRWKEIAIPTALVGLSALAVENTWMKKQRLNLQDAISGKGKNKCKVDDFLQYSPMVAAYALDFTNIKAKHSLLDRTVMLAMSYATMGIVVNSMKYGFNEKRPDSDATNSFPSGHTATAFMGAQFLYEEYKHESPWIGITGYVVATTTGYLRIYNHRHYLNDVVAGACIGIMSTKFAYWLYPKLLKKSRCSKNVYIGGAPYYSENGIGFNMALLF